MSDRSEGPEQRRAAELLRAFGADRGHWPRSQAELPLAPELAAEQDLQRHLDQRLHWPLPAPSSALRQKVLESAEAALRPPALWHWLGGWRWLGASVSAGLCLGLALMLWLPVGSSEDEFDLLATALLTEAEFEVTVEDLP